MIDDVRSLESKSKLRPEFSYNTGYNEPERFFQQLAAQQLRRLLQRIKDALRREAEAERLQPAGMAGRPAKRADGVGRQLLPLHAAGPAAAEKAEEGKETHEPRQAPGCQNHRRRA